MSKERDAYRKETRLIQGKLHSPHWNYQDHIVPPISASVAYRLESAERGAEGFREFANPEFNRELQPPIYIYDRLDEPSRGMLEENLELAEGGEVCVTFASGMAAIAAGLGVLLKSGDTLVSHHTIYGCTYSLFTNWLPRLGIRVLLEDRTDLDRLQGLLDSEPGVMAVYGETPCNPSLDLLDLAQIARLVREHNTGRPPRRRAFTVIDNTFATPFCQRPLEHGIDLVVQSLTKNIGGFGTDMGGAVIGPRLLEPDLLLYRKDFGGVLAPKVAWPHLVYGLPTLALRTRQQIATALRVAQFLEQHPKVERVSYPGLPSHPQHELAQRQMRDFDGQFAPGIMVYFLLCGEGETVKRLGARIMDHIADHALSITLAVSLGQIRTLIEHPSSMTHAAVPAAVQHKAHIDPGGIRLSMGLEHPDDIIADLSAALDAV
jgi:cystathionine beta-lyase/cystathionine gamma-synthase